MEKTTPITKSKNDSEAILLIDLLSFSQIRIIHGTLEYFSILLKEKENPSKKQAENIWIDEIAKFLSKEKWF